MSDYYIHLAAFVAILLLGIEAAVIAARNGRGGLKLALLAVVFLAAGRFVHGSDPAFDWIGSEALEAQRQFFALEWGEKISLMLLRSWPYLFALAVIPAVRYWRRQEAMRNR